MNPRISGNEIVDGDTRIELSSIRSFERTDITAFGWFYINVVVITAFWISGFDGVQWWMCAIGVLVLMLLAPFAIPLSMLVIHTESGTRKFRGTTSRLHDITDAISARLSSEADRGNQGGKDGDPKA